MKKINKSQNFMDQAISIARKGIAKGQTPFGAAIVRNGKLIALTHNRVWKNTDITAHAEVEAIRKACKKLRTVDLSGCTIYSTCEPCPMCFSACHWAKISKIIYGCGITDAKACGFNELTISNSKMKKIGKSTLSLQKGFMKKENLALFKEWGNRKNRKTY